MLRRETVQIVLRCTTRPRVEEVHLFPPFVRDATPAQLVSHMQMRDTIREQVRWAGILSHNCIHWNVDQFSVQFLADGR